MNFGSKLNINAKPFLPKSYSHLDKINNQTELNSQEAKVISEEENFVDFKDLKFLANLLGDELEHAELVDAKKESLKETILRTEEKDNKDDDIETDVEKLKITSTETIYS